MSRKKQTREAAVKELASLVERHLSKLSPEEVEARVSKFSQRVDRLSADRAKSEERTRIAANPR